MHSAPDVVPYARFGLLQLYSVYANEGVRAVGDSQRWAELDEAITTTKRNTKYKNKTTFIRIS